MNKKLVFGALTVALVLSATAFATADVVTIDGAGSPLKSAGSVTTKVTINPKLTLSITTPEAAQTVDFSTLDPGTTTAAKNVALNVKSNKVYSVTKVITGQNALMGLSTTLADSAANAKTDGQAFSDDYSLVVPWTTDPGALTANVQYTVSQ